MWRRSDEHKTSNSGIPDLLIISLVGLWPYFACLVYISNYARKSKEIWNADSWQDRKCMAYEPLQIVLAFIMISHFVAYKVAITQTLWFIPDSKVLGI